MQTRIPEPSEPIGQSFLDRSGKRWWVKSARPNSADQLIIEAQMGGDYPRVALYVMSRHELQERVAASDLKPARAAGSERPIG